MQCRRQIERDHSAQNARAKISTSANVHAKVHVFKFSRLFHRFYFSALVVGHKNRVNLDLAKISCYTVTAIISLVALREGNYSQEEETDLEFVANDQEVCSLTEHKVQFYFHEVFRYINEPSKNSRNKTNSFLPSVFIWSGILKAK